MKNTNIGIVKLMLSNKLRDYYFNNEAINESKTLLNEALEIIKNSPILALEFKVLNNIEGKFIENELIASRYIDNNINLFEVYTNSEIEAEHNKLSKLDINEDTDFDSDKIKLYNAINTLIRESLIDYADVSVDNIHESFTTVLNHIQTPKKETLDEGELVNEEIIEIAVNKFNEKYSTLSEDDKNLLNKLTRYGDNEKQKLLETYKKDVLVLLENVAKDGVEDKIAKTIQKIKEMKYKAKNVDNNIIDLYDLKRGLL